MMNIKLPFLISDSLKKNVLTFINESPKELWIVNNTSNTKNRFFCKVSEIPNLNLNIEIDKFKKIIFNSLGIFNYKHEHIFGNFIGINKEGGNVHPHTDPSLEDWFHVRINFLVQKPFIGGMPVINNTEYDISENECWFNNATLWEHGSTVVKGNKDRIVLSLGAYIEPKDFNNTNKNILKNI